MRTINLFIVLGVLCTPAILFELSFYTEAIFLGVFIHFISRREAGPYLGLWSRYVENSYNLIRVKDNALSNYLNTTLSTAIYLILPLVAYWAVMQGAMNRSDVDIVLPINYNTYELINALLILIPVSVFLDKIDKAQTMNEELKNPHTRKQKRFARQGVILASLIGTTLLSATYIAKNGDIDLEKAILAHVGLVSLISTSFVMIGLQIFKTKAQILMPRYFPVVLIMVMSLFGLQFSVNQSTKYVTNAYEGVLLSDSSNSCRYDYDPIRLEFSQVDCWIKDYIDTPGEIHRGYLASHTEWFPGVRRLDVDFINAKRGFFFSVSSFAGQGVSLRKDQLQDYFRILYELNTEMDDRYRPNLEMISPYPENLRTRDRDLVILKLAADGNYDAFWQAYQMHLDEMSMSARDIGRNDDYEAWEQTKFAAAALYNHGIQPDFKVGLFEDTRRGIPDEEVQAYFDRVLIIEQRLKDKPIPQPKARVVKEDMRQDSSLIGRIVKLMEDLS